MIDGAFTVRELAVELDAPYAAVLQLLERENGRTVRRIDKPGGRIPLWEVVDAPAFESRITAELAVATPEDAPAEDDEAALARRVAAAEDRVLMALRSHVMEDAEAFAIEALAALEGTKLDQDDAESDEGELPLIVEKNVPSLVGRAWIVGAIAGYVTSRECAGLAGQRWRHAFRALASVDLPDQASLQKALMIELVRVVDERADGRLLVDSLARAAEDAAALERFRESMGDGDALWSALAAVLRQHRQRSLSKQATLRLCQLASEASGVQRNVINSLATALRALAFEPDAEIAHAARKALLAKAPPRDVDFWRRLDTAESPAPLALVLEGLGRLDPAAAFELLQEIVWDRIEEVDDALVAALPALASEAPLVVEERFATFLIELSHEQRHRLSTVPARAGLDWSLPIERPAAQHLRDLVQEWRTLLGRVADAPVRQKLAKLGDEIVEQSRETLPMLEPGEQRHVREMLTEPLAEPAGASVAVRAMLAVGAEHDLVEALIRDCPGDTAVSIARWYLDTLQRDRLSLDERKTLVHAVYVDLQGDWEFITTLTRRAAEISDHLPEFYENDDIDATARARMMQDYYRAWPDEDREWLKEYAASAGRRDA